MKHIKTAILLAAVPFALASCGGGESVSSVEEEKESASSSSEAVEHDDSGKTVNIYFWHTFGSTPEGALKEKAEEFAAIMKREKNVTVNIEATYQGGYKDILSKTTTALSVAPPTIAVAYPDHVANYIAKEGSQPGRYVQNIEPYFNDPYIGFGTQPYLGDTAAADEDDFIDAFMNEGRSYTNEGVYSLSYMKSTEVMFYNIEATYRALKIYDPEMEESDYEAFLNSMDWETFMDVCQVALDNKETVDKLLETPAYYDSDGNLFISQMFQSEIPYSYIGDDGKGHIGFEAGEAREDAEELVGSLLEDYRDGLLTTKGISGEYGSYSFTQLRSIFAIGSSGGAGYNEPSSDVFSVGICRVPARKSLKTGDLNPLYVTQGPTLTFLRNASISDEENDLRLRYAWQFAKFLTNTNNNVYVTVGGSEGYTPVRYSCYETSEYTRFMSGKSMLARTAKLVFDEIGDKYLTSSVFPGSAELRDYAGGIFASVASGQKSSVTEAFDDVINQAKGAMK